MGGDGFFLVRRQPGPDGIRIFLQFDRAEDQTFQGLGIALSKKKAWLYKGLGLAEIFGLIKSLGHIAVKIFDPRQRIFMSRIEINRFIVLTEPDQGAQIIRQYMSVVGMHPPSGFQ